MGEKLLAQRLLTLLRETFGKNSREAEATLGWARDNREWLWPDREWAATDGVADEIGWDSLADLAGAIDVAEPEPAIVSKLVMVGELLDLEEFDRELLIAVAALERLPRLMNLRVRLTQANCDTIGLTGQLAGASASNA